MDILFWYSKTIHPTLFNYRHVPNALGLEDTDWENPCNNLKNKKVWKNIKLTYQKVVCKYISDAVWMFFNPPSEIYVKMWLRQHCLHINYVKKKTQHFFFNLAIPKVSSKEYELHEMRYNVASMFKSAWETQHALEFFPCRSISHINGSVGIWRGKMSDLYRVAFLFLFFNSEYFFCTLTHTSIPHN